MSILRMFGMVVFGSISFCMVWWLDVVWISFHAKFGNLILNNNWAMANVCKFGLVWLGVIW